MELNREQIIKALDWLDSLVGNSNDSDNAVFVYQLLGILYDTCEELTEENERLRGRHQWDWTKFYCNGRKGVCDIGNWIDGSCEGCWYYDGKGGHYLYESTRERKERNV